MLFASLFALATLSPPPAPQPSAAPGSVAAEVSHGRLDWFEGSFDELLAQAAREDKLVFLDFWADWCGWCKRLDTDVFSNGAVVREMADLLCLAVDKETEAGGALAQRYGVAPLPTVMFLDAEGQVLDAIVGYVPADEFLQRAQNVKRGIGTLPALRKAVADSPDDLFKRFDLAIRLRQVGAPDAARELARVRQMVNQGIGYDRICQELQAEELDVHREYALLKIQTPFDREPMCLLKMTCPSTGHIHALRVPPNFDSAKEAIRWINWGVTPAEFAVET